MIKWTLGACAVAAALSFPLGMPPAQPPAVEPPAPSPAGFRIDVEPNTSAWTADLPPWKIDVVPATETHDATLTIHKDGRRVHRLIGYALGVGQVVEDGADRPAHSPIRDVTNDGRPNLVITEWNGGNHGGLLVHVLELEPDVRVLATLDAGFHFEGTTFEDFDADGDLEYRTNDPAFALWTSSADAYCPEVVLAYGPDGYRPAPELMACAPPDLGLLVKQATLLRTQGDWEHGVPAKAWQTTLDLLYGGYPELAWTFLDKSWGGAGWERASFLRRFKHQLAESPYWEHMER